MKIREQIYGQEAASILRDINTYHALTETQLLKFYPHKEGQVRAVLTYLTRQGRIRLRDGYYCADPRRVEELDRPLSAAVWILLDFIEEVEYHDAGNYPSLIIFFAGGEVYEIVYAEQGKEQLVNRLLDGMEETGSRYIVLVDTPEQIDELHSSHISGYCTVASDGTIQYYQKEGM